MPKGRSYTIATRLTPTQKEIHPIWRGVGLVFLIVIPIISIAASLLLIQLNQDNNWVTVPQDLLVRWKDPLILIKAILAIIFIIVLYAIFTMIVVITNRFFGPPRFGPYDVPPARFIRRKK